MLIPSCYNNICIVINDELNFLHIASLNAVTISQSKLFTIIFKFGKTIFSFHMHMYRIMLLAVEKERESEESKYLRHKRIYVLCCKCRNCL